MLSKTERAHEALIAVYKYLDDAVRQNIGVNAYVATRTAVADGVAIVPTATAQENNEAIRNVFDVAIENGAPVAFFKQVSEAKINATLEESSQAQIVARIALAYYFEKLVDGADFSGLRDFRERALSIKNDAMLTIEKLKYADLKFKRTTRISACETMTKEKLIDAHQHVIDSSETMIVLLSQSAKTVKTYNIKASHHALVASYKLHGDISKASEILRLSGGVSGAQLDGVTYQ